MDDDNKIINDAVEIYGDKAQIEMAVEEMGELLSAISKFDRGRINSDEVCSEIADVMIMMKQLAIIYSVDKVKSEYERKIKRLQERLAKHK